MYLCLVLVYLSPTACAGRSNDEKSNMKKRKQATCTHKGEILSIWFLRFEFGWILENPVCFFVWFYDATLLLGMVGTKANQPRQLRSRWKINENTSHERRARSI